MYAKNRFDLRLPILLSATASFALLASAAPARAATITTASGTYGADNQIMLRDNAGLNKGAGATFEVRYRPGSGSGNYIGVLRFDLSALNPQPGQVISAASLTLVESRDATYSNAINLEAYGLIEPFTPAGTDQTGTFGAYTLSRLELAETAYVEGNKNFTAGAGSELTGDNAPGINEAAANAAGAITSSLTPLGTISVGNSSTLNRVLSLSGSSLVNLLNADFNAGNGVATIYLMKTSGADGDVAQFFTKSQSGGSVAPSLDVTIAAVPEPTSVATFSVVGATLLRRRVSKTL